MKTNESLPASQAVMRLADEMKTEILRKGYSPGDPFLTASKAASQYGVSRGNANRALQVLAAEGILERREGSGTYIGSKLFANEAVAVRCIHLMKPMSIDRLGVSLDEVIYGIQTALPGVATQVNIFRVDDPIPGFRQVAEQGLINGTLAGMGILHAPREIQEFLNEFRIPAVVIGSTWPDMNRLCSIDIDHEQYGAVFGEYLLGRGHRRVAVLMPDRMAAGDSLFLHGLSETLGAAGVTCDGLMIVPTVMNAHMIEVEVLRLMEQPRPPTVIFGHPYAQVEHGFDAALATLGLRETHDLDLVVGYSILQEQQSGRCPFRCMVSPEKFGEMFGGMLAKVAHERDLPAEHVRLSLSIDGGRGAGAVEEAPA